MTRLHEEVATIAYHFHWPHSQILALEHRDRLRWVDEIVKLQRRLHEDGR